jgi:hypothetical protein
LQGTKRDFPTCCAFGELGFICTSRILRPEILNDLRGLWKSVLKHWWSCCSCSLYFWLWTRRILDITV